MAINFPATPSNNDEHTTGEGVIYTYNSSVGAWLLKTTIVNNDHANLAFSKANSANVLAATVSINYVIDGAGSAIAAGEKGHLQIPFACILKEWTIMLDQSGSISLEVWKDTYANFPPTNADKINTASFDITTATKNTGSTDATTSTVAAGDILAFNVVSATTAQRATIALKAIKT